MHSSGRGDDSPDAYRGVVLPAGRQQPPAVYGEHVQPAGGTPWGAPEGTDAVEPADATQMLPPYPAGDPLTSQADNAALPGPAHGHGPVPPAAEAADATQMLPPYPGADPVDPQRHGAHAGPPPGAVPPQPPVPPQAPQPSADPGPAEATQALPFFQEREDQPGGYEQSGYDQQGYDRAPYEQQPYGQSGGYQQDGYERPGYDQGPADPSYGGEQRFTDQEPYATARYEAVQEEPAPTGPDSDYDHLFRNDVPSPAQIRPRIIQPPDRRRPAAPQAQGPGGGRPPYGGQEPGYGPGYDRGHDDARDGRRMSRNAVIGIVVAGCVVAGLVVGVLLNSGGGGSTHPVADAQTAAPTATGSTSESSATPSAVDDAAKQQATALDALLNTSDASRSSVVNAVASIRSCDNLAGAANDLNTAAGKRKDLITQLGALSLDKLPNHDALSSALTKAWRASSSADTHYAKWADQARENSKVCHSGHAKSTSETQDGDKASGTATIEKKKAVKLWNSIADEYGLTKRQFGQL